MSHNEEEKGVIVPGKGKVKTVGLRWAGRLSIILGGGVSQGGTE